jgi:hypothetical protein
MIKAHAWLDSTIKPLFKLDIWVTVVYEIIGF